MATISESISRIRNSMKLVNDDAFITDRYIYSLVMKYGKALIYRENKQQNIYKNSSLFRVIPCLKLKEVDRIESCCIDINTGCKLMRSVEQLPKITSIDNGEVISSVTSIDDSKKLHSIKPELYYQMKKSSSFKYNTNKYYWIVDGYLYVPDVTWEAVKVTAMFDDDVDYLNCSKTNNGKTYCKYYQDMEITIPEYLLAEAEQMALNEILTGAKIQPDIQDDNQHIMRS